MTESLFLLSALPGEFAVGIGSAVAGAATAMWRRSVVKEDRQELRSDANTQRYVDLIERSIQSNHALATEIRNALR